MITYLIIALVVIGILGFAFADADRNGRISKEEVSRLEDKIERITAYNVDLNDLLDSVLGKAIALVDAVPVSQFKTINKKLEKLGLELVRIDGVEGKKISSLQTVTDEEIEE